MNNKDKYKNKEKQLPELISRKEALKKAGKYAAFTALGTMVLLSPKASQASSIVPTSPGGGWS